MRRARGCALVVVVVGIDIERRVRYNGFVMEATSQKLVPCSFSKCERGHLWPLILQIGKCPGCGMPVVGRKLANCPVCNEPAQKIVLRIDHVNEALPLQPVCKGVEPANQYVMVELGREELEEERELRVREGCVAGPSPISPIVVSPDFVEIVGSVQDTAHAKNKNIQTGAGAGEDAGNENAS